MIESLKNIIDNINTVLNIESYSAYQKINRILDLTNDYVDNYKIIKIINSVARSYATSGERVERVIQVLKNDKGGQD